MKHCMVLTHQMVTSSMKSNGFILEKKHPSSIQPNDFISEKKHPYLYLKVSLTLDGEDGQLTPVQYKYLFLQTLKKIVGRFVASNMVLLKLSKSGVALLRLQTRYAEKLWAAITMRETTPAKRRCAFRVLQVSPFPMGLVCVSRKLR